jgi:hypothetical protein
MRKPNFIRIHPRSPSWIFIHIAFLIYQFCLRKIPYFKKRDA